MRYYFSSATIAYKMLQELGAKNYLFSFAVDAKQMSNINPLDNVIIDSGAFSVWNKGGTIDIDKYLEFCNSRSSNYTFINLDVIPKTGSKQKDIDKCCEQSFENFIYLKERVKGIVMPVYHYGDNIMWLKKYMEHTDYIGISPANDTHENIKREFLNTVFNITKADVKCHGLGYSSFKGLALYPFFSVDSISYKRFKINGEQFWNQKCFNFYLRQRIKEFLNMEQQITNLWEKRGIIWK